MDNMRPSNLRYVRFTRQIIGAALTKSMLLTDSALDCLFFKRDIYKGLPLLGLANMNFSKVAIFAIYSNNTEESSEAVRVVNLIATKFDMVIVVNTGRNQLESDLKNVKSLQRTNLGRDLASYRAVLEMLKLENVSEVLLFNDSVFWSNSAILDFIEFSRQSDYEVTGVTLSNQHLIHLQTYGLHIKGELPKILKPFSKIRISRFKRGLIEAGEKELSRFWFKEEIRVGFMHDQNSLIKNFNGYKNIYNEDFLQIQNLTRMGVPLNPTIHLWAPLFEQTGIIKKALIKKNPARLKFVPRSLVEAQSTIRDNVNLN